MPKIVQLPNTIEAQKSSKTIAVKLEIELLSFLTSLNEEKSDFYTTEVFQSKVIQDALQNIQSEIKKIIIES